MEQFERATQAMQAIVAQSLPRSSASIAFDESYPPLPPTDGNSKLLGMYDQASRDLGLGAVGTTSVDRFGAADVSFVAGMVPMIIDGAGLKGHDDHSAQETADLTQLPVQAKRAAVLLARLGKAGEKTHHSDSERPRFLSRECPPWREYCDFGERFTLGVVFRDSK